MPLTTTEKMLRDAQKNGYAVGAFNTENMEMTQAIVLAAEETNSPVIIATTPSTVEYGSIKLFRAMVAALAEDSKVPIAIHLDHGDSYELAAEALKNGYTSVMIDGSHLDFEENIALAKRVVDIAKDKNIPIEAELGMVGGKEDNLDGGDGSYTDPQMAKEFAERTGISSLAVAIGTAHGDYAKTPVLDIKRLKQIREVVDIPLVLHGASGLTEEQKRECIANGICKINFATELRRMYKTAGEAYVQMNPDKYDPKSYGTASKDAIKKLVIELINTCGCSGHAVK